MKQNIHPKYQQITITCVCGNSFLSGSTNDAIQVDICGACHPFFTGEQRFVDRQGRVDRFRKQIERAEKLRESEAKKEATVEAAKNAPETFHDALAQQKAALQEQTVA